MLKLLHVVKDLRVGGVLQFILDLHYAWEDVRHSLLVLKPAEECCPTLDSTIGGTGVDPVYAPGGELTTTMVDKSGTDCVILYGLENKHVQTVIFNSAPIVYYCTGAWPKLGFTPDRVISDYHKYPYSKKFLENFTKQVVTDKTVVAIACGDTDNYPCSDIKYVLKNIDYDEYTLAMHDVREHFPGEYADLVTEGNEREDVMLCPYTPYSTRNLLSRSNILLTHGDGRISIEAAMAQVPATPQLGSMFGNLSRMAEIGEKLLITQRNRAARSTLEMHLHKLKRDIIGGIR
jgi:hypothetical protein